LGNDPQLARSRDRAFFIARSEDLLIELDPQCGAPLRRFSLRRGQAAGAGPLNPHDAEAAPDGSLFVALYNKPSLAVVSPDEAIAHIDLSPFDTDGNPQAESVRIVDVSGVPKAFVALERLDDRDLTAKQPGLMLRIDVATRSIETAIELAGKNPFNPMMQLGPMLFIAAPGNFDDARETQAGIERFDTRTSTSQLLISEADLGASVAEVAVTDDCGAAIVAGPERGVNPTSLVTFDPRTGALLTRPNAAVLGPTPGYDLQALAWRGSRLYVGDRRRSDQGYRVHIFERASGACTLQSVPSADFFLPQGPIALRPAGVP